eukprot:gnl/MRDRNA2_/MRDRNA2_640110_c0_seq1.p2 gnl/MRDRNA2_/MRDRNA2_640110_c0~~gnl/MRDRNA2_/MRDRNA2_640110_c0_seq1.p2  ORF type:complete len:109 (+),score=11.35 gnl/MRDRNA2_/MRDRNA2_640110_c0_seq1:57-383(+)
MWTLPMSCNPNGMNSSENAAASPTSGQKAALGFGPGVSSRSNPNAVVPMKHVRPRASHESGFLKAANGLEAPNSPTPLPLKYTATHKVAAAKKRRPLTREARRVHLSG